MTLVLKSDVALTTKALGDKHGVISVTDWRYMFDFANDDYVMQQSGLKTQKAFADVAEVTRSSIAEYYDKNDGVHKIAPIDTRRITYDASKRRSGLLVETKRVNYFKGSDVPVSQTAPLATGTNWYLLWIEGSGSVSVTGGGLSNKTGLGTAESPIIFKNISSSGQDVNITVTGSPSFAQLELIRGAAVVGSRIHTTTKIASRENDVYKVKPSILTGLFSGGSGTILINVSRNPILRQEPQIESANPIFEVKETSSGNHIALARVLSANQTLLENQELRVRRYFGGQELSLAKIANGDFEETIAVSWGDGQVFLSQNGRVLESSSSPSFMPDAIDIGKSLTWTGADASLNGIVTKLVIYDRHLTYKELETVTQSW